MLIEYIGGAMVRARYEMIDDEEPYYGEYLGWGESGQPGRRLKSAAKDYPRLSKAGSSWDWKKDYQFLPYRGGKHPYRVKGDFVLTILIPHKKEISVDLLIRILRQANIEKEQWIKEWVPPVADLHDWQVRRKMRGQPVKKGAPCQFLRRVVGMGRKSSMSMEFGGKGES
jgi:hypothetical protein